MIAQRGLQIFANSKYYARLHAAKIGIFLQSIGISPCKFADFCLYLQQKRRERVKI
jgi:hypothetical protein